MYEPNQDSLAKIEAVISGLRMINLQFFNFISRYQIFHNKEGFPDKDKEAAYEQFRLLNLAHFQQNLKFISQYIKKGLKELEKTKIILPPIVFRSFRPFYQNDEYLRIQNENYGVKFIFTDLARQCLMDIEIYRKTNGGRISGLAMKKLQTCYLYETSVKHPESMFTFEMLQRQGKYILDEVNKIFSGEKCAACQKHLAFHNELMVFLPPTVHDTSELKAGMGNNLKADYYHENCL